MGLPRLFYRLPELIEKWGKTQDDILHMAAAGELVLSTRHTGTGYIKGNEAYEKIDIDDKFIQIRAKDVIDILLNTDCNSHRLMYGIIDGKVFECSSFWAFSFPWDSGGDLADFGGASSDTFIYVTLGDSPSVIIIMADEVARIETKYPELRGTPVRQETLPGDPIIAVGWRGNNSIPEMLDMSQASVRKYAEMAGIDLDSLKQKSGQGKEAIHLKLSHQTAILNAYKKYNNS